MNKKEYEKLKTFWYEIERYKEKYLIIPKIKSKYGIDKWFFKDKWYTLSVVKKEDDEKFYMFDFIFNIYIEIPYKYKIVRTNNISYLTKKIKEYVEQEVDNLITLIENNSVVVPIRLIMMYEKIKKKSFRKEIIGKFNKEIILL